MPSERTKTFTLILCCLAQFMVVLDVSIVNVALPSIRSDLGFTSGELQWIVNAYTLTFAGFLLLGGRAADLLGRRRVFMAGMLLFALASLVGGLAEDRLTLVIARAIQGLGGAVVAPATLSILATTFTDRAERNKALGLWGAMGGVGGATGALLGGALTQTLNWRWVLFINLPIGLFATFAAWRVVAEGRAERPGRHFDVAGAVSVTAGLVVLTYGIVRTEVNGWGSAVTLTTLGVGLVLLAVFIFIEARLAREPLMPLRIFRSLPLSAANLVVFALGSSAFAMWYFVTLYLQNVLGYSPMRAGLAFLPMTVLIVVCSRFAGPLVSRRGPWGLLATGMSMITLGHAAVQPGQPRRHLPGRRAGPVAAVCRGDRLLVRAGDHRGHDRGRPVRVGPGVGAGEHLTPGGRLAGPRDPGHDRHHPHRRPGGRFERGGGRHRGLRPRLHGWRAVRARRRAGRAVRGPHPPQPPPAAPVRRRWRPRRHSSAILAERPARGVCCPAWSTKWM